MNALSRPPYYCLSHFPKVHNLARHWQMLREEYLQLPTNATEIHQIGKARIEFFVRFFATSLRKRITPPKLRWCSQWASKRKTGSILKAGKRTQGSMKVDLGVDFQSENPRPEVAK